MSKDKPSDGGAVVVSMRKELPRGLVKKVSLVLGVLLLLGIVFWLLIWPRLVVSNALKNKDCTKVATVEKRYPGLGGETKAKASGLVAMCAGQTLSEENLIKAVEWSEKAVADWQAAGNAEEAKTYEQYVALFKPIIEQGTQTNTVQQGQEKGTE